MKADIITNGDDVIICCPICGCDLRVKQKYPDQQIMSLFHPVSMITGHGRKEFSSRCQYAGQFFTFEVQIKEL